MAFDNQDVTHIATEEHPGDANPPTLRAIREAKDLTQKQVAKLTHLDQTTISALERGKVGNPTGDTLKALARVYECSTDDISNAIRQSVLAAA